MFVRSFIATALLLTSGAAAYAQRAVVPVKNYENIPFQTASGKPVPLEKMRVIFTDAGSLRKWTFTDAEPGKLRGTLVVRGRHLIQIEVLYTPQHYSILYTGSEGMKYAVENGTPMIHPFYNQWVSELMTVLTAELQKY